MSAGMDENRNL